MVGSPSAHSDSLRPGVFVQRSEPLFPAESGLLAPAERQLNPACGGVVVHEHLADPQLTSEPVRQACAVRPEASGQPVRRAIGKGHGLGRVAELRGIAGAIALLTAWAGAVPLPRDRHLARAGSTTAGRLDDTLKADA